MKKSYYLLAFLVLICFFAAAGCGRLDKEEVKATVTDLTSKANHVFNLFGNPLEYDAAKQSITGEHGDILFPVIENGLYNSINDIKKMCESIFTAEYCSEHFYDFGFGYKSAEDIYIIGNEEADDPVYIEKDSILYVNSSLDRFMTEMVFDYDRFNIIKQSRDEITIRMDVFDYNFYPREQAVIKLAKTEGNWRISFLFD